MVFSAAEDVRNMMCIIKKFPLQLVMKAQMGNIGIALPFL
jgi:hypothetical protein